MAAKPISLTTTRAGLLRGALAAATSALLGGCADDKPRGTADNAAVATNPALVHYKPGLTVELPDTIPSPAALALLHDGGMLVGGSGVLARLAADGSLVAQPTRVNGDVRALALAIDGGVLAAVGGQVQVHDEDLRLVTTWPAPLENSLITSIAADGEQAYVADSAARRVHLFSLGGKLLKTLCERDEAHDYPGLIVPSAYLDVAVAPDGTLFVGNPGMHRIEAHKPDGSLGAVWGKESMEQDGFCGCCNPTDFALLPDGRFVTAEKGIPRIKIHGKDGAFECFVAPPEQFAEGTAGIDLAVSDKGRIYALDPKGRRVIAYDHVGAGA